MDNYWGGLSESSLINVSSFSFSSPRVIGTDNGTDIDDIDDEME